MSWGMYVVPDDPIRNTPEKAEKYYKVVWAMMDQEKVDNLNRTLDPKDIEAAAKVLRA
jgi:hypothetical protein